MRHLSNLLKLAAIVAICSIVCTSANATVTLDIEENGLVGSGLRSYTLTATGTGIMTLSRFTIDGDVYQVFGSGGEQSDWIGDGSASPSETTDSHVLFGQMRLPDLGGATWDYDTYPQGPPDKVTVETITGGGTEGFGTLINSDSGPAFNDVYMMLGAPSTVEETVDLIQIVVQQDKGFSVNLKILTASGTDPNDVETYDNLVYTLPDLLPGDANRDQMVDVVDLGVLSTYYGTTSGATWETADFTGDGMVDVVDLGILSTNYGIGTASAVPEPSALCMLAMGVLVLAWRRRK